MAVVTRADCTQTSTTENTTFQWTVSTSSIVAVPKITDVNFNACTGKNANNNLEERVRKLNDDGLLDANKVAAVQEQLVGSDAGECNTAIEGFLATKNISRSSATATS